MEANGNLFEGKVAFVTGGASGIGRAAATTTLAPCRANASRDGGAYVPVRGWDGSSSERDIRIRPVMVMEALTRTDWLNELRDLAASGAITLRVAGEYPPERAADAHRAMEAGGLRGRGVIIFQGL
jgi:NADPH2:quinone reductase